MRFDLENLPSDTALLHRLVREMADVVESRDGEIERLQIIIKKLQRAQFGRRSERLDAYQQALALEGSRRARSPASGRAVRRSQQRPPMRHPGASRCPIICRAKTFCSTLMVRSAAVAVAHFMPLARA